MNRLAVALVSLAVVALGSGSARAQAQAASNRPSGAEDAGAREGQSEGRLEGLEVGRDEGRDQAYGEAWLRGFRRGLTQEDTWRRDTARDEGLSEGERPGRATGLGVGHERGRDACAAAFLRLQGRPSIVTEPAPPAPPPPPPPLHPACAEPPVLTLQFSGNRSAQVRRQDCENGAAPLGWDVPRPDYPDAGSLRDRARLAGFEDDALEAWMRGYKTAFKSEFTEAYRTTRDQAPAESVRRWERDGENEGRREGERRRACADFARGYEQGWREGFDVGFERGFIEAWDETDRRHSDNPVVRILSSRLLDESRDGVIEPGEGLRAELDVANAGLRDSSAAPVVFEGARTVSARGALSPELRAQSRRTDVVDLGRADEGAPFGAGVEVRLRGENGDELALTGLVGRPVVIDSTDARLDVVGGELVTRVRARIASVAERDADRSLSVAAAGGASVELGTVRARELRDVDLVLPAQASAVAETSSGSVELRSGETTWMRRDWTHEPRFGDALLTAARLPAGSAQLSDALTALSRRLHAELARAMDDPKLYRRLDDGSDLAELARVRPQLPAATRSDVESRLTRPLLQQADARSTPRKVRRAIREALGKPE